MPDSDNGRVTLAVLSTKLDNLLEKIEAYHRDAEDNVAIIRIDAKEREERIRTLEQKIGRIEERQTIWAAAQGIYATIAAAIAGFIGAR